MTLVVYVGDACNSTTADVGRIPNLKTGITVAYYKGTAGDWEEATSWVPKKAPYPQPVEKDEPVPEKLRRKLAREACYGNHFDGRKKWLN